MARIAIVVGHVWMGSFCEALAESYARGARSGGHEVQVFVTAGMKFDPILHDGFSKVQALEPDLQAAHDAILAADHLVIIFPLWMGSLPAIMKGFLERVLQPDLVEPYKTHKFPKLLRGKSVRVMITMGMPGIMYRCLYRAEALHVVRRNMRSVGAKWVLSRLFGYIDGVGDKGRRRWLQEVEGMGRRCR